MHSNSKIRVQTLIYKMLFKTTVFFALIIFLPIFLDFDFTNIQRGEFMGAQSGRTWKRGSRSISSTRVVVVKPLQEPFTLNTIRVLGARSRVRGVFKGRERMGRGFER